MKERKKERGRKGGRKILSRVVEKETHAPIWKSEFFLSGGIF